MAEPTGVFAQAYNAADEISTFVQQHIDEAQDKADLFTQKAVAAMEALKDTDLIRVDDTPPAPLSFDPTINVDLNLEPITPTSFGAITSQPVDAPVLEPMPAVDSIDIPEFTSSVGSLSIPTAPAWSAPGDAPARPAVGTVDLPVSPSVALPAAPTLVELNIPTFDGVTLPEFDATLPEFEGTAITSVMQWTEPQYRPVVIEEVVEVIRRLWDGELGLPAAVEQAMYERAAEREALTAEREISAVATEFSARGFTMPTGMEAARVDQMRQDLALKQLSMNRELTIEFAKIHVENVRFAVQQGIAAENVYVNLFTNMAERLFQAAKFRIESQLNVYNAQVQLFNARMQAYQTRAQVFDIRVRAALSAIEVFKAEVEAEIAKGQINEQRVRTYTAMVQALQTDVEIYKAKMQGAQLQSELIRSQIEAYRADVQAYAERIQADKVRFDAYEAQVRGEASKAGIIDAEARAYAALIQGKSAAADIDVKRAEVTIQTNRARIEQYTAALDAEKNRIASQLATIQAAAQAYTADTQRYTAVAGAEAAKAQLEVSAKEAELRTNVALYQAQIQAYVARMDQAIRQAQLIAETMKSAGSMAATLAAGAMASVHVGANLSGGSSVGASGNYSESFSQSNSTSTSTTYSYEGT